MRMWIDKPRRKRKAARIMNVLGVDSELTCPDGHNLAILRSDRTHERGIASPVVNPRVPNENISLHDFLRTGQSGPKLVFITRVLFCTTQSFFWSKRPPRERLPARTAQIVDDDLGALFRQRRCLSAPDTAAGARDDGDFPFQTFLTL